MTSIKSLADHAAHQFSYKWSQLCEVLRLYCIIGCHIAGKERNLGSEFLIDFKLLCCQENSIFEWFLMSWVFGKLHLCAESTCDTHNKYTKSHLLTQRHKESSWFLKCYDYPMHVLHYRIDVLEFSSAVFTFDDIWRIKRFTLILLYPFHAFILLFRTCLGSVWSSLC